MKFLLGLSKLLSRASLNRTLIATGSGATFECTSKSIQFVESKLAINKGYVNYQGEEFCLRESIGNSERTEDSILEKKLWLETLEGAYVDIDPVILIALNEKIEKRLKNESEKLFYYSSQSRKKRFIYYVDLINNQYDFVEQKEILLGQIESNCYTGSINIDAVSLSKYNEKLELCWQIRQHGVWPASKNIISPMNCDGVLIFNFLAQKSSSGRVDGEIYAIDDNSGDVLWTKKFPLQVDDVVKFNDDIVLAYSGNDLYKLNVSDGEIIQQVPTSFGENSIVQMTLCGDYVFLFNDKEEAVHIYHKESFTCEREISFTGQTIFNQPVVFDTTLYVGAYNAELGRGLFAFDTTDIHAELDIEQQLNFKVIDPPEPNSPLVIEIHNQTFDDIARLGEQFIIRELWEHGKNSSYDGRYRTKGYFNGQVILKCYDIPNKPEELKQYVADMEERITLVVRHENYGMGLRSSDGENYATLTIELIDTQ